MKLHLDTEGKAVLENGMPVYLHEDGKAIPFDAVAALNKISALNGEAKNHREAKEALEAKLKAFAGIDDPAKAREALLSESILFMIKINKLKTESHNRSKLSQNAEWINLIS